jgi:hypothetical protein
MTLRLVPKDADPALHRHRAAIALSLARWVGCLMKRPCDVLYSRSTPGTMWLYTECNDARHKRQVDRPFPQHVSDLLNTHTPTPTKRTRTSIARLQPALSDFSNSPTTQFLPRRVYYELTATEPLCPRQTVPISTNSASLPTLSPTNPSRPSSQLSPAPSLKPSSAAFSPEKTAHLGQGAVPPSSLLLQGGWERSLLEIDARTAGF